MLANGLIHSGIRTEMDAALALLSEHVESKSVPLRVAAIIGYEHPLYFVQTLWLTEVPFVESESRTLELDETISRNS